MRKNERLFPSLLCAIIYYMFIQVLLPQRYGITTQKYTEHFYLFIQSHTSLDLLALTPPADQKLWQVSKHLCICFCFSLLVLNRSTQLT